MHVALAVDPRQFAPGRHFAAWLGLAPKDRSTGGKQRLGGISRAGNETLRSLLVMGATAVVAAAIRHPDSRCTRPGCSSCCRASSRGGAGQQDSPDYLGHDVARRGLSERHPGPRLVARLPGARRTEDERRFAPTPRSGPRFSWRNDADRTFGRGVRIPSGPAASCRANRPDTRSHAIPDIHPPAPLAPTGPSTHGETALDRTEKPRHDRRDGNRGLYF